MSWFVNNEMLISLPHAPTESMRLWRIIGVSLDGDVGRLEKNEVELVEAGTGSSGRAEVNIVCNVYGV